ncbi:hypothetical protein [Actinophytocola sediminis]
MAITKKGSRRIVVDGAEYRWTVRPRPSYCQGNGWSPMTFAVGLAEQAGRALVVSLPWAHPSNWLHLPTGAVRPAMVARAIQFALTQGWDPSAPGSPFSITLAADSPVIDPA